MPKSAAKSLSPRKPNIIWIMSDDLNWGDLGCFGSQHIHTPAIDALCAGGMRFTHCHSGSTVCAPSRSCFTQGLHQGHATVRDNMIKVPGGTYRHALQPGDTCVAQVLKGAGYATGLFGKWGLALCDQYGVPNVMGFDSFYGYLNQRHAHSYYPDYLFRNREREPIPENLGHNHLAPHTYDAQGRHVVHGVREPFAAKYSFDLYAAESLQFVRANAANPFFLYLAYTIPHGVPAVPELGEYTHLDWPSEAHKVYAAMVTRMDRAVGELVALLKELKLFDDTLIFFASDNGYTPCHDGLKEPLNEFLQHAGPWKGVKGHLHHGGVRVPALAHWPGHIRPGTSSDQVWAFWDFLPTAAEVAGVQPPAGLDGLSILPTLLGDDARQKQHDHLYWEYRDEQSARIGNRYVYRPHPAQPVELYDAEADPRMERNLAAAEPKMAMRAADLLAASHTPTLYQPSPGEALPAWWERLKANGVTLPNNVDG